MGLYLRKLQGALVAVDGIEFAGINAVLRPGFIPSVNNEITALDLFQYLDNSNQHGSVKSR